MKYMSASGQKWLKGFHLLFVAVWLTCGTVMLSFSRISESLHNGEHLFMLNYLTDFIDMKILVPAAMLTLLTGLIYSLFTGWGFFKQRWLIFKWVVTLSIIVTGTIFTGPWVKEMAEISLREGTGAFASARYIFISSAQFKVGVCMNATLIITVFVSVLKPWKKKSR